MRYNRVNFSYWRRMFWMFFSGAFQHWDCKSRLPYTPYGFTCLQIFLSLFSLYTDIWLYSACIHVFILDARRRGSAAFYNPQVQRESFCLQQAGKTSRKHASPTRFWQGAWVALIHLLTMFADSSQPDIHLQIDGGWLGFFPPFSFWFKVLCIVLARLEFWGESSLFAFLVSSSCVLEWSVILKSSINNK